MHNQAAEETTSPSAFVEMYLDCMDNLPNDVQRHLSRMRELDITNETHVNNAVRYLAILARQKSTETIYFKRTKARLDKTLFAAKQIGEEKLHVVQQVQDLVENKTRQLDLNAHNLDFGNQENTGRQRSGGPTMNSSSSSSGSEGQSRRNRRMRRGASTVKTTIPPKVIVTPEPVITQATGPVPSTSGNIAKKETAGKKKKRNSQQQRQREESPIPSTSGNIATKGTAAGKKWKRNSQQSQQQRQPRVESTTRNEDSTDSDEATYCLCNKKSYGKMILCDNELCPIEWFHFSCVNIAKKPKGKRKWFCPKCRGDCTYILKPKAQLIEELEKYTKEEEEKA